MRQQSRHGIEPLAFTDFVKHLANLVRTVLGLNLHSLWRAHELRRQFRNALGVSGRKKQGLTVFGALAHHFGDVIEKAHVQHAVGFVQHQRVDTRQTQ